MPLDTEQSLCHDNSMLEWLNGGESITMYKTDLVRKVAKEQRLSQRVVNDALTTALDVIEQALASGQTVTCPGFGTFYTRKQPEGMVREFVPETDQGVCAPGRCVSCRLSAQAGRAETKVMDPRMTMGDAAY